MFRGSAKLECGPTLWTTATPHFRRCQARSRDYNAAWQVLDKGPLNKEPVGRAVVIGGGIAGLASALGLAKWGMSVQVLMRPHVLSK